MHARELPTFSGDKWLADLVEHATRAGACMRWGCTTCGATAFRRALLESAKASPGQPPDQDIAHRIANQCRDLDSSSEQVEAIRFVIMFLDAGLGQQRFQNEIVPIIAGSVVEREYLAMLAHHKKLAARRREHELQNDPQEIVRRMTLREEQREQRLVQRARQKEKIDRAWRERTLLSSSQKSSGQ